MRALALIVSLLVLLTLAPASAAPAETGNRNGAKRTPTELWREFPLRTGQQGAAGRPRRAAANRSGPARSASGAKSDDGVNPLVWIAVLVGVAGVGLLARGARRRTGLGRGQIGAGSGSRRAESQQPGPAPHPQGAAANQALRALPPPAADPVEPARPLAPRSLPAPELESHPSTAPRARPAGGTRFVRSPAVAPIRRRVQGRRAFGYVTALDMSKEHRRDLTEQTKEIHRACRELGVSLTHVVSDIESPDQAPEDRPGLTRALERLAAGEADCLVVTELRRLAPTAEDWSRLGTLIDPNATRVVAIDVQLDTNAEQGEWELMPRTATPGR
jgi:hypothetical protein